jgi:hypothetical protein
MQDCAGVFDCLSQSEYETDSPAGLSSTADQRVPEIGAAAVIAHSTVTLSHDNPDTANNDAIDMALAEHHPEPPSNTNASANQQQRWSILFFSTLIGMGIATFCVLAGGKVGLFLPRETFQALSFAVVDIAVTANDDLSSQEAGRPSTSTPQLRNAAWKRGVSWLAIGLLTGTVSTLWKIAIAEKDAGTVWQPVPIIFIVIYYFICALGLWGCVMMRAHRDRRPNVLKYYIPAMSANALPFVGDCSPYPLISTLGSVLSLLVNTFGLYFLVMKVDKDADQRDVQNGYKLLVAAGTKILWLTLFITRLAVSPFVVSAALMLFQKVVLRVIIPVYKKCFGNDKRKLWSYPLPALVLSLELGPCLLLLSSNIATLEFWALLMFQEANSLLKNTGKYADLYVAVRALLHHPVGEETLKLMDERRSTLAPCDNVAEIVSPMVLLIAIGLEAVFESLPFERAPYFADSGVMEGWRQKRFRGEAPIMLTIIFFIRILFCWIEIKLRARQRGNEAGTSATSDAEPRAPQINGEHASGENGRSNVIQRRSSMAVLYHRIVLSDDAPVQMQYMAGALFALQQVLFVFFASQFGKQP